MMAPTITDELREQFHRQGYLVTPVIFEPETLAGMRAAFQREWDALIAAARPDHPDEVWRHKERPFIANMHLRQPECAAFLKHPSLLALARQLIGPDVDVNYNQAVIKPPTGVRENYFPWHQDSFYALRNPDWDRDVLVDLNRTFQGWVALTETTVANGTLWVITGGHRGGVLTHLLDQDRMEWNAVLDESAEEPVELQPGQMLVFSGLLPHRSKPNVSTSVRMIYQFNYSEAGSRTGDDVYPVLRGGKGV